MNNCATCGEKINPQKAHHRDVVQHSNGGSGPSRRRHAGCRPNGWGLLDVAFPDGVLYVTEVIPQVSETYARHVAEQAVVALRFDLPLESVDLLGIRQGVGMLAVGAMEQWIEALVRRIVEEVERKRQPRTLLDLAREGAGVPLPTGG